MMSTKTVKIIQKKNISPKKCPLVYAVVIAFLIVLLIKYGFRFDIPAEYLLVFPLLLAIFGSDTDILAFAFCCVPFSIAFQYKYAILILLLGYSIKALIKKEFRTTLIIVFVAVLMLWELLHCFSSSFSIGELLREFTELLFLAIITGVNRDKIEYKSIVRAFSAAVFGICMIMLFVQIKKLNFSILAFLENAQRFGNYNTDYSEYSLNANQNQLSIMCIMAFVGELILFWRRENDFVGCILSAVVLMFGFLTLSRTYIVALAFVTISIILCKGDSTKRKRKTVVFIAILFAVLIAIILAGLSDYLRTLVLRYRVKDISNGRIEIFSDYHDYIYSSIKAFFFGTGLQEYMNNRALILKSFTSARCHNSIQELWVVWGLPGVIVFSGMVLKLIGMSDKRLTRRELIYYVPIFVLIFTSMAGQFVTSGAKLLLLPFSWLCLNIRGADNDTEELY